VKIRVQTASKAIAQLFFKAIHLDFIAIVPPFA
jgi:hypothetical protein